MSWNTLTRWKNRRFGPRQRRKLILPTASGGVVVSWCGMRGIVTLAAALALPIGFPHRDLIVFSSFAVVLGTLVLQGVTLRPLLLALTLPADRSVEEEGARARAAAARAALAELDDSRQTEAGLLLVHVYEARVTAEGAIVDPTGLSSLRRRALAAERRHIADMRHRGEIGDDAYHVLEEELDWAEADLRLAGDDGG